VASRNSRVPLLWNHLVDGDNPWAAMIAPHAAFVDVAHGGCCVSGVALASGWLV
jgi:hypothetical protein